MKTPVLYSIVLVCIQPFRERLSYCKCVRGNAEMFVGNGCLPFLDRISLCSSQNEGESMNIRTQAISLHLVKATRTAIKQW